MQQPSTALGPKIVSVVPSLSVPTSSYALNASVKDKTLPTWFADMLGRLINPTIHYTIKHVVNTHERPHPTARNTTIIRTDNFIILTNVETSKSVDISREEEVSECRRKLRAFFMLPMQATQRQIRAVASPTRSPMHSSLKKHRRMNYKQDTGLPVWFVELLLYFVADSTLRLEIKHTNTFYHMTRVSDDDEMRQDADEELGTRSDLLYLHALNRTKCPRMTLKYRDEGNDEIALTSLHSFLYATCSS